MGPELIRENEAIKYVLKDTVSWTLAVIIMRFVSLVISAHINTQLWMCIAYLIFMGTVGQKWIASHGDFLWVEFLKQDFRDILIF
jgi:predicted tellurium resistance membrane protein TerC